MSTPEPGSLPLVSLLCITYNQREFVTETVNGMVRQDYPNLEIIIADDGSTDGTVELLRELAASTDRSVTVIAGEHVGITENCNRGLRACRGKYFAITGGDDILLPTKISRQVEWMEADPARALCGHDVDVFESSSGRTLYHWSDRFPLTSGIGGAEAVRGVPFCATAIMLRCSAIPDHGFDPRIPIASDWKLWVDCLHPDGHFGYVEGVLARYRRHDGNVTSHANIDRAIAMFDEQHLIWTLIAEDYPDLAGVCQQARVDATWEHAKLCWQRGRRARALGLLGGLVVGEPRYVGRRLSDYVQRWRQRR